MKKINSERYVNKLGKIPAIYMENINELIDKVNELEGKKVEALIHYGLVKQYRDWTLYFEEQEDGKDCFIMRNNDGTEIGRFPELCKGTV